MTEESLFKPKPIKGFACRRVVYIPVDSPGNLIRKHLEKSAEKTKRLSWGQYYLIGDTIVLFNCVGAPNAVCCLEGLIASGAEEILVLGFCGSLHSRAKILDVFSIQEAFSQEGTSLHYFPLKKRFFPEKKLRFDTEHKLQSKDLPYSCGSVVSTDAPFRETESWLKDNLNRGIDCVDMETSAVFALAEFRGISSAALLLVTDELAPEGHVTGFLHSGLDIRVEQYFFPLMSTD